MEPGILQLSFAATFAFFLDSADTGAGGDDADGTGWLLYVKPSNDDDTSWLQLGFDD